MNRKTITIITPETVKAVTLSEAKLFIRVDGNDDDALIQDLVDSAIEEAKNYTRRSLINRTLKMTLDAFPMASTGGWWDGVRQTAISELHRNADVIELPLPPLVSVTSVVTYNDANTAATMTASDYYVDTAGQRIVLKDGAVWPVDLRDRAAIEITYVSGYGATANAVPASLRTAIKMHVQEMYEMRQFCEPPEACRLLLDRYRVRDGLVYG